MYETERLRLCPFTLEYFEALQDLFCNNELVMRSTLKGRTFTLQEFTGLIANHFTYSEEKKIGFMLVLLKATNELMGVSGLLPCDYLGEVDYEFGFILHEKAWGKGCATELGALWIQIAQQELNLKRVLATTSPENIPSQKVLKKLGLLPLNMIKIEERGQRLIFQMNFD